MSRQLTKERLSTIKATAINLILDIRDVEDLYNHIDYLEGALSIKLQRLDEYRKAWDRQQGIINNLSEALQAQEGITLNNLKCHFTFDGILNSIKPSELENYISKVKK